MHTTLRIDGANCPFCFNDAIDELKLASGVLDVQGSLTGPCIDITNDATADVDVLTSIVRERVHGTSMYANEIEMVPLEPSKTHTVCDTHDR